MAETTGYSVNCTTEEFIQLARTDINKFLTEFLKCWKNPEFDPEDIDENGEDADGYVPHIRIQDGDEYDVFGKQQTMNGVFLKKVYDEGGEDKGSHIEFVMAVMERATGKVITYFRQTGYYSSYDRTNWQDKVVEVEPRQVQVTQYFLKDAA